METKKKKVMVFLEQKDVFLLDKFSKKVERSRSYLVRKAIKDLLERGTIKNDFF